MKKIPYIFYNELKDILHDPGILIFILFVPLAYPLLYSWVYTNEVVREVPVVVVDESGTARSREFISRVDASPDARVVARCRSMEEARQWVMSHEAYGIYWIPRNFALDIWQHRQTTIGCYCDMSSMLYYKALYLAATDVSLEMNKDIKIERLGSMTERDKEITQMPVEYEHIKLYNPSSGFASFLIPPVLMLILQQTLLLGIGMQMGRTRENWQGFTIPFDRHYKWAPNIVVGKALVYLGIYLVMDALFVNISPRGLHPHLRVPLSPPAVPERSVVACVCHAAVLEACSQYIPIHIRYEWLRPHRYDGLLTQQNPYRVHSPLDTGRHLLHHRLPHVPATYFEDGGEAGMTL